MCSLEITVNLEIRRFLDLFTESDFGGTKLNVTSSSKLSKEVTIATVPN